MQGEYEKTTVLEFLKEMSAFCMNEMRWDSDNAKYSQEYPCLMDKDIPTAGLGGGIKDSQREI